MNMVQITAQLVKDLRDRTRAGMMECKKALLATNGDIEKAEVYLRKRGLDSPILLAEWRNRRKRGQV